jgi:hypothetical protein
MKKMHFLIIAVVLMSTASAELTEFQRGMAAGLEMGLKMGKWLGAGDAANVNANLDSYNNALVQIFGNNETILSRFRQSPLPQGVVLKQETPVIPVNQSMVHTIGGTDQTQHYQQPIGPGSFWDDFVFINPYDYGGTSYQSTDESWHVS